MSNLNTVVLEKLYAQNIELAQQCLALSEVLLTSEKMNKMLGIKPDMNALNQSQDYQHQSIAALKTAQVFMDELSKR